MGRTILIVDDEPAIRFGVSEFLGTAGYEVSQASGCKDAEAAYASGTIDAVLLDYRLPDGDAFDLLASLKRLEPGLPVVMLTGNGSIELAVEAMKRGADHFLTKPIELPVLLGSIQRLIEQRRVRSRQFLDARERREPLDPFVGTSAAIRKLADEAHLVLDAGGSVLIQGETGTGKGVLARWIHEHGPRRAEPFVDFNGAGLSSDLFESELFGHERGAFTGATSAKPGLLDAGNCGTFFLDEIGDVALNVQPKLLKVVEEKRFRRLGDIRDRHVDVRLIAATHRDLTRMRMEGTFRDDLYFRIATFPLQIPPLRERPEDIVPLAESILRNLRPRGGPELSRESRKTLERYRWPGNSREVRNVLERAMLLCTDGVLQPHHLACEGAPATPSQEPREELTLAEVERRHIVRVLEDEDGKVETAARRLGIPRSSLYQKMREYGLSRRTPRR